jgi:hypothetical protein
MSDEFAHWNDLARLWRAQSASLPVGDVERQAHVQRALMHALAAAEAVVMALVFGAALWIAMQTAFVSLTAVSLVSFGGCAFLQHRLRREPGSGGEDDLLTSLESSVAREDWNLAQLRLGRAVNFLTLFAIGLLTVDRLANLATTPVSRMWGLASVAALVLVVLGGNLLLTRVTGLRRMRLASFALQMRAEFAPTSARRTFPD